VLTEQQAVVTPSQTVQRPSGLVEQVVLPMQEITEPSEHSIWRLQVICCGSWGKSPISSGPSGAFSVVKVQTAPSAAWAGGVDPPAAGSAAAGVGTKRVARARQRRVATVSLMNVSFPIGSSRSAAST
jgi:hypothetical protein